MFKSISIIVIALLAKVKAAEPTDSSTNANIDEVRTSHLALDLKVFFENKTISGKAMHIM